MVPRNVTRGRQFGAEDGHAGAAGSHAIDPGQSERQVDSFPTRQQTPWPQSLLLLHRSIAAHMKGETELSAHCSPNGVEQQRLVVVSHEPDPHATACGERGTAASPRGPPPSGSGGDCGGGTGSSSSPWLEEVGEAPPLAPLPGLPLTP
jgi:hypothetical protein